MSKNRIVKIFAVAVSVLGLSVIGVNVNHGSHFNSAIVVHASNRSLYNRVSRFAVQRRRYHYPQITFNTRDLGGLRAMNGRYEIKPHMLYRTANLHYISRRSAREINRLRIHKDIDLRQMHGPNSSISKYPQPGEFHKMGSRGTHIHYYHFPVENTYEETVTLAPRRKYGEAYRFGYWYTNSPTARRAYHNSVMEMIRNGRNPRHNGPLMYNCTQGRDRTGTLSIITEYLLGVRKATIYNDFLLTNYYHYQSSYDDQIRRINRFYSTAERTYGSMWNYVRSGLDLSMHNIRTLRHEYLRRI